MDKYIVALLNNNLRVIIPEFGAFIIKQKEPKIIVFNEDLNYDDGLLIDFMMKTEGVEKEIAQQQLSDFLTRAAKILDDNTVFTIEDLGSLRKDFDGRLSFTPEGVGQTQSIAEELRDEPIMVLDEEPPEPKPENKASHLPSSLTKKPGKETDTKTKGSKKKVPASEIQDEIHPKQELREEFSEKPDISEPVSLPVEFVNSSRWPSRKVVRWLLIILLANSAVILFLIYQDQFRNMFKPKPQSYFITDSLFDRLSDSVKVAAVDTSLVFKEVYDTADATVNNHEEGNLRYYIVAGCFRDEVNADDLVKSLKDSGFNAEKFGTIGNLYAVSFVSFEDKELAVKELKRIREEIHPEAWMTRF
jgi:hypothetical protein